LAKSIVGGHGHVEVEFSLLLWINISFL